MYKSYLIVVLAAIFSSCGANLKKEALQEKKKSCKAFGWTTIRKPLC